MKNECDSNGGVYCKRKRVSLVSSRPFSGLFSARCVLLCPLYHTQITPVAMTRSRPFDMQLGNDSTTPTRNRWPVRCEHAYLIFRISSKSTLMAPSFIIQLVALKKLLILAPIHLFRMHFQQRVSVGSRRIWQVADIEKEHGLICHRSISLFWLFAIRSTGAHVLWEKSYLMAVIALESRMWTPRFGTERKVTIYVSSIFLTHPFALYYYFQIW